MMISTRRQFFALSFALLAPAAALAQDTGAQPRPDAIQITETGTHYVLTVPTSRLVMRVPKGSLVRGQNPFGGSANNPRYFLFTDKQAPFNISGWFEPQRGFAGLQKFWDSELAAWKKPLPPPQNVTFGKTGGWETITYDLILPSAPDVTQANMRAQWVQAGTWIDLHVSLIGRQPAAELRTQLAARLAAISVSEKK